MGQTLLHTVVKFKILYLLFRLAYIHLTLDHSSGQGQDRAYFECEYIVNGEIVQTLLMVKIVTTTPSSQGWSTCFLSDAKSVKCSKQAVREMTSSIIAMLKWKRIVRIFDSVVIFFVWLVYNANTIHSLLPCDA